MTQNIPEGWTQSGTVSVTWSRRFEFAEYAKTRDFLDALAEIAKDTGVHPDNIGFGRDYANITLEARKTDDENAALAGFAGRLNEMARDM